MRRVPAWKLLIGIFAAFWIIFATVLFVSDIPFYVVIMALTTILALSALVVALAWAWTHNF